MLTEKAFSKYITTTVFKQTLIKCAGDNNCFFIERLIGTGGTDGQTAE